MLTIRRVSWRLVVPVLCLWASLIGCGSSPPRPPVDEVAQVEPSSASPAATSPEPTTPAPKPTATAEPTPLATQTPAAAPTPAVSTPAAPPRFNPYQPPKPRRVSSPGGPRPAARENGAATPNAVSPETSSSDAPARTVVSHGPLPAAKKPAPFVDLRGKAAFFRQYAELPPHDTFLVGAAILPSSLIAALSLDGELRLSDPDTGKMLRSIPAFDAGATWLAISPQGDLAAVATRREVRLIELPEGRIRHTIADSLGEVRALQFSASGQRLIASIQNTLSAWDTQSGEVVYRVVMKGSHWNEVHMSADRRLLLDHQYGPITTYDAESGEKRGEWEIPKANLEVFATSPDGKYLVTIGNDLEPPQTEPHCVVYELPGLKRLHVLPFGRTEHVEFGRDGRTLVGDSGELFLFDVPTGKFIIEPPRTYGQNDRRAVDPNRDVLLLRRVGDDRVRLGAFGASLAERSIDLPREKDKYSSVDGFAVSPDGKSLIVSDSLLYRHDALTGKVLERLPEVTAPQLAYSANGEQLFTLKYSEATIRDPQTLQAIRTVSGSWNGLGRATDRTRLVTGQYDGTRKVLDLAKPDAVRTFTGGLTTDVDEAAFSADGTRLATCDAGVVEIWNVEAGELERSFAVDPRGLRSLVLSSDGRWLAGVANSPRQPLWIIDANSGQVRLRMPFDSIETPRAMAFIGGLLIGNCRNRLRVWNPETGKIVNEIEAHTGDILFLSVVGDGPRFATLDNRGRVSFWNAQTLARPDATRPSWTPAVDPAVAIASGTARAMLNIDAEGDAFSPDVGWIAVSPDGRYLAAATMAKDYNKPADNRLNVWNAQTLEPLLQVAGLPLQLEDLAFSADGKQVFVLLHEEKKGRERRGWTIATPAELPTSAMPGEAPSGRLGPPAIALQRVSSGWETVHWDAEKQAGVPFGPPLPHRLERFAVSANERFVAVQESDELTVFEMPPGRAPRKWTTNFREGSEAYRVASLAFDPVRPRLFVGADQAYLFYDAVTGRPLRGHPLSPGVLSAAYSPDGRWLAVAARDASLSLFDAATLERIAVLPGQDRRVAVCVAFSPDSRTLFSVEGGRLAIRDVDALRPFAGPTLADLDDAGFTIDSPEPPSVSITIAHRDHLRALDALAGSAVESLDFNAAQEFTRESLAVLQKAPRLRSVSLRGCSLLPVARLREVLALPGLEELTLPYDEFQEGPLTPAIAATIAAAPRLRSLRLGRRGSDAGVLDALGAAGRLEDLKLDQFAGSAASLQALARWPALRSLVLHDAQLQGVDLGELAASPRLERLDLQSADMMDADAAALVKLTGLREVNLSFTKLTDASVERLAQIKSLRKVSLRGLSDVTDAAVEKLKTARPDLKIER